MKNQTNIMFLHHSTGRDIWNGGLSKIFRKLGFDGDGVKWFENFNKKQKRNLNFTETYFPKKEPYGWNNYPYDYYNIWVKNAGDKPYKDESTLEMLTKKYDVIIFKHCFPVSNIQKDDSTSDINSDRKTLGNYRLQYEALKKKLLEFPDTKFILWTPTAQVENNTNKEEAERANDFSEWVKTVWDTKGDNIFLWDFRALQTEGGLFFKNEFAQSAEDSHPNGEFAETILPYFSNRVVNIVDGKGDSTSLTGKD